MNETFLLKVQGLLEIPLFLSFFLFSPSRERILESRGNNHLTDGYIFNNYRAVSNYIPVILPMEREIEHANYRPLRLLISRGRIRFRNK